MSSLLIVEASGIRLFTVESDHHTRKGAAPGLRQSSNRKRRTMNSKPNAAGSDAACKAVVCSPEHQVQVMINPILTASGSLH